MPVEKLSTIPHPPTMPLQPLPAEFHWSPRLNLEFSLLRTRRTSPRRANPAAGTGTQGGAGGGGGRPVCTNCMDHSDTPGTGSPTDDPAFFVREAEWPNVVTHAQRGPQSHLCPSVSLVRY